MLINNTHLTKINSPVRNITAKVELYNGSALAETFSHTDRIKYFDVERVGEEKFFGFGVCQKLKLHLVDPQEILNITTAHSFKVYYNDLSPMPRFNVTETHRDENTGELSVTAYDCIYKAQEHTVSELGLTSYTIQEFATACANIIGASSLVIIGADSAFTTSYESGANFDGTELIRDALNDIAEATQTIYYINSDNALVFKRLDVNGDSVLTIDKEKYITLESSTNRRLATIHSVTELGDNVYASITESGSTQYIRDNPFWELRDDIVTLVNNALAAVGGLTINQFECVWRGNYLLEIGDKITLVTKKNGNVDSYMISDTISYNGSLSEKTEWKYTDSEAETASNPTSLGDALKQTYARVDKANKQIDMVVNDVANMEGSISELSINSGNISASVQQLTQTITESTDAINEDIYELNQRVEAQITAEDVRLEIESELANGVDKVTTATGFTFNDVGLTIEKSGSEMKTQITEDGMTVYKDNSAVLTANNVGVDAVNLHATTYLIIGTNSRFEDYGSGRTGCFWIGE